MADGYARPSGRFGVCLGIGGPGAANLVAALANAYADESPILAITGEVQTDWEGRGSVLKLKTASRDDTTHLVMAPLEFMQRLAARAIEERPSVTRFAAPCRARRASGPTAGQAQTVHRTVCVRARRLHLIRFHGVLAPCSTNSAKLRAMMVPASPQERADAVQPAACEARCAHGRPARMSWGRLLKRAFSCDITWVQVSLR